MNVWLAVVAGLLAIFGSLGVLNPYTILICIFLIGIGFAFNAPAWTAIVPEILSDKELPSAATLGGLQLNISGILGPAIGGMLLPLIVANWVFMLNAICFLIARLTALSKPCSLLGRDSGFIGSWVEETEARINRKYRNFSKVFVKSA